MNLQITGLFVREFIHSLVISGRLLSDMKLGKHHSQVVEMTESFCNLFSHCVYPFKSLIVRPMNVTEKINLELLMESSCDDRNIALELIQLYFDLTSKELDRLEKAAGKGDAENVSSVAHKCAGSSAACGMMELGTLLRALELDAKQGMPENLPDQLGKIREGMAAVRDIVQNHFNWTFTL